MFNFFSKINTKKKEIISTNDIKADNLPMTPFESAMSVQEKFTRIDWIKIKTIIEEDHPELYDSKLWDNILKHWLKKLSVELNDNSTISESKNFILLSNASEKYNMLFLKFMERCHHQILRTLIGITVSHDLGKFPIIIFENQDAYYAYSSYYYAENGQYSMSSGMFIGDFYGHFILPHEELIQSESVSSHELTHAMVAHLPLPLWLNEGLAVNLESIITGFNPYLLNTQMHNKHQMFWNEENIQLFWSGKGFSLPGEISNLSYQLAQLIVRSLSEDYSSFKEFTNLANYSDAGESAAKEIYGNSLGVIIGNIFGDGSWSPDIKAWDN